MLELAFQYHVSEEAKSRKHLLRKLRVTILANLTLLLATYGATCRSTYFLANWIPDWSQLGGEEIGQGKMQKWMNKIESPRGGSEGKLSLSGIKVGAKVPFDQSPLLSLLPNIKETKTPSLSWEKTRVYRE